MNASPGPEAWIETARRDVRAARRLLEDPAELEMAAYHVQQAAEKVIKAVLCAEGVRYPRGGGAGHDPDALSRLVPTTNVLHARASSLADVTPWATAFRYPADDPLTAEPAPIKPEIERRLAEAEAFIEAATRQFVRASPGSEGFS